MKKLSLFFVLAVLLLGIGVNGFSANILFDYTKDQRAGNADWVIDTNYPVPSPSDPTAEDDWDGAISAWGYAMYLEGHTCHTLISTYGITYGDGGNAYDLSNYDVFVVCEPQDQFTTSERDAILAFVNAGGGLFMVADHWISDRNSNGWDSPEIWNDFGTETYFGLHFQVNETYDNFSYTSSYVSSDAGDPIVHGSNGDVSSFAFHGGTAVTLNTGNNATAKGHIWRDSVGGTYAMFASAEYGSGRVCAVGDSSPADDGTGYSGDTLYDGWNEANDKEAFLNGMEWLLESSCDGTDITAPDWAASGISNLTITPGNTVNGLDWDDASDAENPSITYSVYRDTVTGFTPAVGNKITSGLSDSLYTDTGLSNGTTYYYRVSVENCVPLSKTNNVGDEASGTPSSGGGSSPLDISNYQIIQYDSAVTFTFPADTSINPGQYIVIARSANQATFETDYGTLPGGTLFFNGFDVIAGNGFPVINGNEYYELKDNGGITIETTYDDFGGDPFTVKRNNPGDAANLIGSWTSDHTPSPGAGAGTSSDAGLVINEYTDEHTYQTAFIELCYDAPAGGSCNSGDTTAPVFSGGISGISVADQENGTVLQISWNLANDTENPDSVEYALYRSLTPNFTPGAGTLINTGASTSYTDTGLTLGTTYYYSVQTYNCVPVQSTNTDEGMGIPTDPALAQTLQGATPGDAQVSLTWSSVTGSDEYRIFYSTINGGPYTLIVSTTVTSYTHTGLSNDTTYYYVGKNYDAEKLPTLSNYSNQLFAMPTSGGTGGGCATDLIISEYVESGGEKYIEIYNGTGSAVDLSDYELQLYSNGSGTPTTTSSMSGNLNDGTVIVYKNSGSTQYPSGINATAVNFNGDDAFALYKISTSTTIDVIGQIGFDPGSFWGVSPTKTADATLVRKSIITAGDADGSDVFDPATEWNGTVPVVYTNLGSHTMDCGSGSCDTGDTTPPDWASSGISNVAVTNSTTSSVELGWDVATDSENTTEAIKYDLYRSESSPVDTSTATLVSSNATALTYTDNTVSSGTTYYYKVVAKNCVPLEKTATDEIGVTVPIPAVLTIYDVQYTAAVGTECYDSPELSNIVTLNGIVSAIGTGRYTIEEASGGWHGILIIDAVNTPTLGDSVTVTGTVDEYFGLTELTSITAYTVNSSGNTIDTASTETVENIGGNLPGITCSATDEPYEGVLVTFYDVEVSSSTGAYGYWRIKDQGGTLELDCDDTFYSASMTSGTHLDQVTGILLYGYDRYRLNPRNVSDIIESACNMTDTTAADWTTSGISNISITDSSTTSMSLLWDAASDTENTVVTYDLYRDTTSPVNTATSTLVASDLSTVNYINTGLTEGTTYYYRVVAKNCVPLSRLSSDEVTGTTPSGGTGGGCATDLIISEYIEGSGVNKAIEIYNGTGSSVDLTPYVLEKDVNGDNNFTASYDLTGTLADGDVFVLANSSANAAILAQADATESSVTGFNGNDQIRLVKSSVELDHFGVSGGSDFAKDITYVRKSSVTSPVTGQQDPATNGEWDGYAIDTTSYLGAHTMDCGPGSCDTDDTTPPDWASSGISNIAVTNSTTSSVELAWDVAIDSENTTEPIKYDLYRSETTPVDTSTATMVSSNATAVTYTDNTVSSGTTYYYKVVAKNCVPLEKTATDEVGVTVPTPSSLTIYDVQYTASVGTECYDSAYLGQVVTISGIVSATGTSRYILEEASGSWHGVLVYDSVNTPTRGDSVTITGTVDEYFGLTEMTTITSYTVNSTGNTVDSASTLTVEAYGGALPGISCGATQEPYEGVLVTFYDVEVSSTTDASGRWRIKDQSGTNELDVDDRFYSASMTLGEQLDSVTGVILYEYDRYRLNPRDASDIVAATCDMGDVSAPVFGGGDSLIAVTDPGTGGALQITWNTATDPENPVLYAIYRSLTADFTPGVGTLIDTGLTTTSYNDSGLTNGLEYFYTVQAYNCAGLQTTNTDEDSGTPTLSGKDWTIAVYLNCDNNLEPDGLDDFLEMAQVGSDANINIVAQVDRISGYSTAYGDWTSTKRFYITNGMTPDAANAVSDIGEANMGDGQTLVDFAEWVYDNYPAQHYMLVIWDHGDGWRNVSDNLASYKGASSDDTSNDYIYFTSGTPGVLGEMGSAFSDIYSYYGAKLDIVGYDVCLDQMWENNAESAPYFDYMVASEMSEWLEGWSYDIFLNDLAVANGNLTPLQLSNAVVDSYADGEGGSNGDTQSSVDLAWSDTLTSAINDLAIELRYALNSYSTQILSARGATFELDSSSPYDDQIDLYDLCLNLESAAIPQSVKDEAVNVRSVINSAVTNNFAETGYDCYGVGIYYPYSTSDYDGYYDSTLIAPTNNWDEFIQGLVLSDPVALSYSSNVIDDSSGNSDGVADPGESVSMSVDLGNSGTSTATNVFATLSTGSTYITIIGNTSNYPDITSGGTSTCSTAYAFSVDAGCPVGTIITFTLNISADGPYSEIDTFEIMIGTPPEIDVSGWKITQIDNSAYYIFPADTKIPAGGYLIVGRDATQAAFETAWGVSLPANVVYLNSANACPQINGDETFKLEDDTSTLIDGITGLVLASGQTAERNNPGDDGTLSGSWTASDKANATPGSGVGSPSSAGVVINEYSDADAFANEFVEIYYDAAGSGSCDTEDTTPPDWASSGISNIAVTNSTTSSVALAWDVATDSENTTEPIKYDLYRSETTPVDTSTATLVSSNGTAVTYTDNTVSSGTTYYYKVVAKNCVPLEMTATDEIGVTVPTPAVLTIYDVQYATVVGTECYDSPELSNIVTLSGLVSAAGTGRYVIEEDSGGWHGILIYDGVNNPSVGDSITVTGTIDEYFGLTELTSVTSYSVNSTGNTLHNATTDTVENFGGSLPGVTCSAGNEPFEGVLMTFYDVTVSSSTDVNGNWRIKDQSGTNELDVDDTFYNVSMSSGDDYSSVTGIVLYEYDRYRLNPRNAADIVAVGCDTGDTSPPDWASSGVSNITVDDSTASSADLSWDVATDAENADITYDLYRSETSPVDTATATLVVSDLSVILYTDSTLSSGTTYYYKVVAKNCVPLAMTSSDEATAVTPEAVGGCASDLIMSEYIEGSAINKAIEIYNGTGSSVDLTPYALEKDVNGDNNFTASYDLTGTLADGDVFVLANSSANAAILAQADATESSVTSFNGNDQIRLVKSSVELDHFGVSGGSDFAKDITYVRKSSVTSPVTGQQDPATNGEWDGYAIDTTSYLGSHTMNCGAGCDTGDVTAPVWASGSNIAVADAQSGGTLDISWDAATDPENGDYIKYALYRSTETGFTVDAATLIDTNISTLAYNDTGLTNGSTYYYIVQAYNCAALQTSNSDEDFGIPTDPAQAPTLLTANGGDTLVGLTWSSVTGSDEYRVYYSTFDGGPYTLIHSTTANSYEQTGLTNGTTYYYVVVNYDAEKYPAVSANSNQLSAVPDVPSQNDIDVSGWKIVQYSSTNTYTIPNGIIIPEGGYLVVGRNADKTAFETFWGVTLASDVIYVNSSNSMPLINGDEYFELLNDSDVSQDGPSAKTLSVNNTVERTNPGDPAGDTTSWTMTASTSATPGSGVGASSNAGVIVNEYSDASSYEYEFVELYNDTTGPPDLTPPVFAGIQSVTDTQLGGELELAWNTATDTSTPIMYNVYMSTASAGQNFASVSYSTYSLSYLITGLENGTQYYFVVRAEDSRGNEDTNTIEISGTPTSKFSDPGFGDILINEFSAKGTERIEIYNTSGIDTFNLCSVDIESYTGVDEVDVVTGRSYIEPGEYLTFFPDNIGLSNLGNTIVMTIGVTTIDQVAYGVEGGAPIAYTGYSTARVATTGNDADDWNRDTTPTFGSVNDAPAVSLGTSVVINEYMKDAGSDTNVLELYNPTGGDIDVTGWLFTDADDSVGDIGTLSGTVTADSYLVFTRDAGTPMADVVISGDNVYLYDASGIRVDQASDFGHTFTAGNTAQRVPNGTGGTNNGYDWASAGFTEQEPTWNESNDLCNYSDVTAPDWAVSGISNVAGIENGDHISVSWDAAIDAENPDRIFYSVYRSTETPFTINASTLIETDLQTLAYDDYSVIKGETNYYMIATYNCNVLETEGTDEVAVYMPNPPITPLLITCVGGNNYVFIDWSDVAGVDHYVIYSSTESGGPYSEVNTTVVSQYSDSGLINGVTYYYVVTSYDTDKDPFESPYSNEKFAIPEECLPIGDTVMISEIMIYPRAEITNEEGEWIELYNPTASPISIVGWSLSDTGIDTYTIPAGCPSVPAYDYLVLGATDNLILNDYVAVDFVYNRATGGPGAFALGNSGDEVILKDAAGDTIDMLIYTSAWFDQGYSITKEDIMACSDEQSSWGNETTQWNPPDSSYGTPGTSNFPFGFYYAMAPSLIRIEFSFTHEVDMATADDVAKYLLYETATPANEVSLTVLTFSGDITTGYFSCVALTPGVEYTIEIIGAMQDAYFHPVTDSHKLTTFIAPTPLLEGDNPILFPEWSKDGTKVAYIVYNKLTGKSNIWKQNRDGTDAMQVTVDADNVSHAGQFSFSPNGAYFIFTADGGGYTQIRRISKTGGEASVLMEPVSEFTSNWGRWCDPHWGSSANQFGGTERVICSISGELWAYDPVTIRNTDVSLIKLTELTSGTYTDTYAVSDKLLQPKWAPDNTAITFVRRHAGEGVTNSDIYVISNIQSYIAAVNTVSSWVNSDVELISGYSEPCWSPSISVDGTQVSYVIDQNNAFSNVDFWTDPDAEFASANFDAYYEAVDGSQSDGSVLEANPYNEGFMKWAPAGGDQFIYTSRDSGGIYSLNVINHQITQGFTKSGLRVQDYSLSSMDITEGGYLSSLTIESPIHIPEIMGNYEYIGESRKFSSAGNDDAMINAVVSIHFMNEELKDRLTSSLKLLYYNEVMGDWEELASKVELDSIGGCVSAEVYSLGIYAIASKASVVSDDLGDVVVYPNPYYAVDLTAPLSFETKWAVEEILIYSVSGELLDISLVDFDDTQSPQLGSGGYTNRYDLSKSKLEDYASGVYLIVFKGAEETVTCKFALIK